MKKICAKCKVKKGLSEFHKNSQTKDGLAGRCKVCRNAHNRNYANTLTHTTPERIVCSKCGEEKVSSKFSDRLDSPSGKRKVCRRCESTLNSKYHYDNIERIKVSRKFYRENNKEVIKRAGKRYREENSEKLKVRSRELYLENRDAVLKRCKEYVSKNVEAVAKRQKAYRESNKLKLKLSSASRYDSNRKDIRRRCNKINSSRCRNDYYTHKLPVTDDPKFILGTLTVRCKKCGKRFSPTNQMVGHRVQSFRGNRSGDNNFYCSNTCKKSCDIFGQKKYPKGFKPDKRELQGWWAAMIKELDGNECVKCGSKENLHAHHIEPLVKTYDSWTEDNGITFCAECHYKYAHQLDGCTLGELQNAC